MKKIIFFALPLLVLLLIAAAYHRNSARYTRGIIVHGLFEQLNDVPKDAVIAERYASRIAEWRVQLAPESFVLPRDTAYPNTERSDNSARRTVNDEVALASDRNQNTSEPEPEIDAKAQVMPIVETQSIAPKPTARLSQPLI